MKQTSEQKVYRIMKLHANGMELNTALRAVGLSKPTYWTVRKRIRERELNLANLG